MVPADGFIPSDPAEGWHRGLSEVVGCTALVCERCGARVRWVRGLLVGRDVAASYAEPNPPVTDSAHRTWFCQCTSMAVGAARTVDAPTDDGFMPPWTCSGHPEPTLPWRGHGVMLDRGFIALDVARAILADGAPAEARPRDRQFPEALLARLVGVFGDSVVSDDLNEAIAALLVDASPLVRVRAADYARRVPTSPAAARIRSVLETRRDLMEARDPSSGASVEVAFAVALGHRAEIVKRNGQPVDPAARKFLLSRVAVSPVAVHVLPAVARIDSGWLARNAPFVAATAPNAPRRVLEALVYNRTREAVPAAVRLIASGDLTPAEARSVFEYSSHPDRLAALARFPAAVSEET